MKTIVVGGGVIGLSIAWKAAAAGMHVSLIDPAPGSGASWVAGGMLAPVAEAARGEEALTALGIASVERWPAFAADLAAATGLDAGLTDRGTLVVARDTDDAGELHDLLALQRGAGLVAEPLTSREARRLEPSLAPSVRGALWMPADQQVDNRMLLRALLAACTRADVGLIPEAAKIVQPNAVTVASGVVLEADAVVVATGAGAAPPELMIDGESFPLPVRPVKGQIVRVRANDRAVFPTRTVRGVEVYVIPRSHGEIAIGATSEERGYDTSVTAGAVRELLHAAWQIVPGLAEAEFIEAVAGLRPGTPDNAPLIGRWRLAGSGVAASRSGVDDGPFVATGHYRSGVLLAPITADAIVAMLLDQSASVPDDLTELMAPFDPSRFATLAVTA